MRSLRDDIVALLAGHEFSIPGVSVRTFYDETPRTYPLIVVQEIDNRPLNHGTVNGERYSVLGYQIHVLAQHCKDKDGIVLNRWEAARRLVWEASDVLDAAYKVTRRSITEMPLRDNDTVEIIWRGDVVLATDGYSYRI